MTLNSPLWFIKIIDATGTNLIENATIHPKNIIIEGDFPNAGFQFIPTNDFAVPDSDIREFDNSLNLSIQNKSSFRYTINLDSFETINLSFSTELTRIFCEIAYFTTIGVTLNEETIEIKEISLLQFLVIVKL